MHVYAEGAVGSIESANGGHVSLGEVDNVDVVTHACAVRRGPVVAEDLKLAQPPDGHLSHVRHQVVRHTSRVLADQAGRVRAHRVEVTQVHHAKILQMEDTAPVKQRFVTGLHYTVILYSIV